MRRRFLIREALNSELTQHSKSEWKKGMFELEAIEDFPLTQEHTENLLIPKEDPLA